MTTAAGSMQFYHNEPLTLKEGDLKRWSCF
jgi:hypothetical protein